jgi:hypothetical protein
LFKSRDPYLAAGEKNIQTIIHSRTDRQTAVTYITYTHTCMYAFMHTYIDFHTYVPTYLYTHIPPYLCIYIPLYLYLYLYTYVPAYIALHCITLQYITLPTCMNTCIHTLLVDACIAAAPLHWIHGRIMQIW